MSCRDVLDAIPAYHSYSREASRWPSSHDFRCFIINFHAQHDFGYSRTFDDIPFILTADTPFVLLLLLSFMALEAVVSVFPHPLISATARYQIDHLEKKLI